MESADFYITLPSNANMTEHPDNRPGKFKVELSQRHELHDGVWEIALTEIQFTNNWTHRTPEFDLVAWVGSYITDTDLHKSRPAGYVMSEAEERYLNITQTALGVFVTAYVRMPAGEWRSEHDFGDELARRLKSALNDNLLSLKLPALKTLRYERKTAMDTVEFKTDEGKYLGFTTEHDEVMRVLGFSGSAQPDSTKVTAYVFHEGWSRILGGFPTLEVMFVYSSVCEEQHIGDQTGNLLKAVPVTVEHGKRQCERYSPATYVRLRPSTLSSIDIQLLDKTGSEIAFADVNTIVVLQLHVRKRRSHLGWC
jgi:hypothetical protein